MGGDTQTYVCVCHVDGARPVQSAASLRASYAIYPCPLSSIIKSNDNSSVLRSVDGSVTRNRVLLLRQNGFINLRFVAVFFVTRFACGPITLIRRTGERIKALLLELGPELIIRRPVIAMISRHRESCGHGRWLSWKRKSAFYLARVMERERRELSGGGGNRRATWKLRIAKLR